jgi:predicted Zn-dependent protease
MPEKDSKKTRQRIIMIISGLFFLGSVTIPLVGMFSGQSTPETGSNGQPGLNAEQEAMLEQLKAQEKGYQSVLEREPNNPVALQGLVQTRIQLGDAKGTIAPLEKLIQLYPDDEQLKNVLTIVKQQVELENQQSEPNKQE